MVEFGQVFTPADVYRFIRERDRNHDFVLDSTEIPATFISRYDKKEGAFSGRLESFELMQARRFVCPWFFPSDRIVEEQRTSHRWLALNQRLIAGEIPGYHPLIQSLGLAAYASVGKGRFFSHAVEDLSRLAAVYSERETAVEFPWAFRSALTLWGYEIGKEAEEDWLLATLSDAAGRVNPSDVWSLYRRVREEGTARQTMDFISALMAENPRLVSRNNFFENSLAFVNEYDPFWPKRYSPVGADRQKSLLFAAPLMMADKTGKSFIEYPLREMLDQGYSDQEIAALFNVYRNKRKETMLPLAQALTGLEEAGIAPGMRLRILEAVARFDDEPAKSALMALAQTSHNLGRLRSHYAVQGEDQKIVDLLSLCFSKNRENPGEVVVFAGRLAYAGWNPARIETVVRSLPELDGWHYYNEVVEMVQRFSDQLVYEGDIARLFSALGFRYHGREGSALFVRKIKEAYLLVEPSPLTRKKSGVSDHERFQMFIEKS